MKKMNFTFSKLRSFMSFLGLVSILSWSSSTLDAQTMNCANTTINLLAGECTTNFTPNIIATAPAAPGYTTWETTMPTGLTPSVSPGAAAGTSGQSNVYFDLQNTSGSIKQFWGMTFFTNSTIPAPAGTVYKVYRTTNPGSYGGANRTTAANWTLIGTYTSTAVATSGEAININFSSPVNFGIGASYGFYVESSNIAAASIVYSTTAPASIAFAGGLTGLS